MKFYKKTKLQFNHYLLIVVTVLVIAALYFSWTSHISRAIRFGERINFLLIGTDWVDYARHSDTLIFVSYDPKECFLDIISIPRDTKFRPKGYTFRKINEIYTYHYRTKKNNHIACQEVRSAVEELFKNKIKIPYYVNVDYSSFVKFIDLIGGVTIDIDEPMHYDDFAGKLHIHFESGRQKLNGKKALDYVRFRGVAGDVGRIFRQQLFMKSVLQKSKNPYLLFKLPQSIYLMTQKIKTNLSYWDLLVGSLELRDLKIKNIRLAQLPGKPRRDYWKPDIEDTLKMLDKIIPSSGTIVSTGPKIRVDVWNASGVNGLAEHVSWKLRKYGYDVVDFGTFSVRQKKTLIKDLHGDLRSAQAITGIIKCGEVITRYNAKRFVDISVILGEDCKLKEKKQD